MRKVKLEGKSLEHIKMLQAMLDNSNVKAKELEAEMNRLREEAHKITHQTMLLIKEAEGLKPNAHAHVDATYLKEFNFAVLEIHDEDEQACDGNHEEDIKSFLN